MTASVLEKDKKHTKGSTEVFLLKKKKKNENKNKTTQIFKGILFFKPGTLQNKQITYFLPVGFFQLLDTSQVAGRSQPAAYKLFVGSCNVRALKQRIPLKICILSCFV